MASVKFSIRNFNSNKLQPIYMVYRFGRNEKLVYPIGFKVKPVNWNKKAGKVRDKTEILDKDIINNALNEIKAEIERFITEVYAEKRGLTKAILKNFLDEYFNPEKNNKYSLYGFIDDFILNAKSKINPATGQKVGYRTLKKYENLKEVLKEYEQKKDKVLSFNNIDLDFYYNFIEFQQSKKLATNTIGRNIKTLKTFLNDATEKGINKNLAFKSPRFKAISEESENIYLDETELKQIYNTDLSNKPNLDKVKDLFLIGCWTGLRFSDFTKIEQNNISKEYIEIMQQKTRSKVVIPLHPVVISIWKKYNGSLPGIISNQKFNEYIKQVVQLSKIDKQVYKTITKGGIRITKNHKKYDLVTSHTARRSFATNLYKSGFPAHSIMQITGHKTEKAFLKYIKVTPEEHAKLLKMHWVEKGQYLKTV